MKDLMDDDDLKKSVIDKMMGELDDVTSSSLKKPAGPVKGVEIAITVSPKSDSDEEEDKGDEAPADEECTEEGCEDPMHDHAAVAEGPDEGNYISQLLKKMG